VLNTESEPKFLQKPLAPEDRLQRSIRESDPVDVELGCKYHDAPLASQEVSSRQWVSYRKLSKMDALWSAILS